MAWYMVFPAVGLLLFRNCSEIFLQIRGRVSAKSFFPDLLICPLLVLPQAEPGLFSLEVRVRLLILSSSLMAQTKSLELLAMWSSLKDRFGRKSF
jgi:hypothetical protein